MSTNNLQRLVTELSVTRKEEFASRIFSKALSLFVLLKVVTLYYAHVTTDLASPVAPASIVGKVIFLLATLADKDLFLFTATCVAVVATFLAMRVNYFGNVILLWIVISLFRFKAPVLNGSDIILLVLSIYNVGLAARPLPASPYADALSTIIFNTSRILIQFQIILIYFISGWDKLLSSLWRTGVAFAYIPHLDVFFNSNFEFWFQHEVAQKVFAWLTILFELLFAVLVYKKRTRFFILCVGVIFHLIIWAMFNLPDFALLMILSYLIFLRDTDYNRLRGKVKPQLP